MEQSHSPTGHHGHAGMAEEGAGELELLRIGGGLSNTAGQRQPLAPVTSSDPPPMRSSPRSGGDPDEEMDWSKRLRKDCVSEIVSEASSDQEQSNPPPLIVGEEGHPAPVSFRPTKAVAAGDPGTSYFRQPDEEQGDPSDIEGEGSPSGVQTIEGHIIDVTDMEDEILRHLKKVLGQKERIYRIYRVPEITRSLDKDAYAPHFVSFGPYHRDNKALSSADQFKWYFLELIRNMGRHVPLKEYLEEMNRLEETVEEFYEEDILTQKKYGCKMLLLDGCCILGFLGILPLPPQEVGAQTQQQDNLVAEASTVQKFISRVNKMLAPLAETITVRKFISRVNKMLAPHPKHVALAVEAESERIADSATVPVWPRDSVRHDLLLMENQLPFIVLEKIYELATAGTPVELKDKVDQTIQKLLASYPLISITTDQSFHHLLHCCHLKFRPAKANSSSSNSKPTGELQPWRGATDLYKAGIKFKPKLRDHDHSLLDVELVSGKTLMIPTLIIEDSTSSVFRNLIAFEHSCTNDNYFAAYAFFMGELMRTPADVTLLVKKGVIENYLGSDKEVSDFFNNLIKRVAFDFHGEHFLSPTLEGLKSSYNNVRKKHMADLRQNHCSSPWVILSVAAGTIGLVFTFVTAVHTLIRW